MAHDAIVIGGGIVGCAVAAHLAASGRSTLLLERSSIGAGASGRNSGVIQHPIDPVLVDLYRTSLDLYRTLEPNADDGFVLGERPSGLLMASLDARVAQQLTLDLAPRLPAVTPTYLAPGEVTALEPSIDPAVSACWLDIGHPVGPLGATRAYAARATAAGVEIREGVAAGPWLDGGRVAGVSLVDADGADGERLPASDVIVAAGPWSPALIDPTGAWRPIVPRWGVVVDAAVDAPPRHVIEEAWIDIEPPEDGASVVTAETEADPDEEGDHAFSLVTAGGRSSVGSTFLAEEPDGEAWVPALLDRGARFVPALAAARRGAVRVCARPLSLDGRPLIGAVPGTPGLWIAAGHGPWGISTGPAAGPLLVELLDGGRGTQPAALDPGRFGVVPIS